MLEEYKALYSLVVFRMTSLEQRIPIASALLAATLSTIQAASIEFRILVLIGLPIILFFLLESTINHARSFEDVLRRIEELETALNELAGQKLLAFQAQHPSRHRAVGGRIGHLSVRWVVVTNILLMVACAFIFRSLDRGWIEMTVYAAVLIAFLIASLLQTRRYTKYRYLRPNTNDRILILGDSSHISDQAIR